MVFLCPLAYEYLYSEKFMELLCNCCTLSFSHLYRRIRWLRMSTFLNVPLGNTCNEWTDFVFSVKSFIKLKAEYCILLWCVSVVSRGFKFEHFFFFFFFVIFTNVPAVNSQLVAEELRHEHMLWKRGSFTSGFQRVLSVLEPNNLTN